jgi:hypothetical protein
MPSLRELQQRFAVALFADPGTAPAFAIAGAHRPAERIAIYRRTVFANYRNALGATYPVVQRLVGKPFFDAAVDAFVRAHPSRGGDLNVYGDAFGAFLAVYPPAGELPYLTDVARLEWAIDEANRAADATRSPDIVLGTLAIAPPERLPALRMRLEPSCRLVASEFPVLRIWQVNQAGYDGDDGVSLDDGPDHLLVRRDANGVALQRIAAADFAWLAALSARATLALAIDKAQGVAEAFDLGAALHAYIGNGTIAAVVDQG